MDVMDRLQYSSETRPPRPSPWPWLIGVVGVMLALSFWLPGCASPGSAGADDSSGSRKELSAQSRSAVLVDSEVDITYVLGHDLHRFLARAKDQRILGRTFLDRELLKKSSIDGKRYSELFEKAADFVQNPAHRAPDSLGGCRSPFTVKIRAGAESLTTSGCRTANESGTSLSQLARDAEYLLYSGATARD